ncbi:hypothetical protein ASE36_07990 [Rhizobium sp. Root274]|uniref:hypothetical protein n=1 Tax=unclassified Rhizobium TaxID=2613769 RepID=UPI000715B061|nr:MULTISPECIES: hypothetical protein [unclassified Rhizobium]KQW32121.1 hypothetical protein ASC71_08000 [Rhizobium sp. Root1240]KRD33660.1 hypothetical protein ASE36_07990 [Rhizobium sp. Root274]
MLGPVSAQTNLYQPISENRTVAESRNPDRVAAQVTEEPYSTSAATAIAGNLNIMLLSAPERMSQNLVILTEVLASVLKMKQEPNEPLTAFAARLIDAIATLAPAEQQKLRALLSEAFAGLQLRTLLQALRNPQGPEAATLAIYLELYRQKERDPGARAIISSYRQNGDLTRAPPLAESANTVRTPRPSASLPTGQTASLVSATAGPSRPAETPIFAAATVTGQAEEEERATVRGAASPGDANAAGEGGDSETLSRLRQMRASMAASAETLPAATISPSITERASPSVAALAEREPDVEAEADPAKLTVLPATQDTEEGLDGRDDVAHPLPAPVAGTSSSPHPSLPAHLLEEVAEIELIRTLLALYAAEDQPDMANLAFEALMADRPEEPEPTIKPSTASVLPESVINEVDLPSADRPVHLEERLALTTSIPLSDHQEPSRSGIHGNGLPLAFVNYVIETDHDPVPVKAVRKDAEDDAEPEQSAEDDRNEASGDEPSGQDPRNTLETSGAEIEADETDGQPDLDPATSSLDAANVIATLPSPEPDPAQALYLRLSDFV